MATYGYRTEKQGRVNKRDHEVNEIVVDEEEAAVVRLMFQKYVHEGYGAQRINRYLYEHGHLNRSGCNFSNTTIVRMLKNIAYTGIIKNGEAHSGVIEDLRIIDDETFNRAQEIMKQRTHKHNDIPYNGKARVLLSGKVYCGYCGTKLTVSTYGSRYMKQDGVQNNTIINRYTCFYKIHHPQLCEGQTSYSARMLDQVIEEAVLRLFRRVSTIPEERMVRSRVQQRQQDCKASLSCAKQQLAEREKEYADYRAEVLKVIRGESKLSMELLNELVAESEEKIRAARQSVDDWKQQLKDSEKKGANFRKLYKNVVTWADLYEACNLDERKMIVSQLIEAVRVFKNYRIEIEFATPVQQILEEAKPQDGNEPISA